MSIFASPAPLAFARKPLPKDSPYIPPEARAVAVEPPEAAPQPLQEPPGAAVERLIRSTIKQLREDGELREALSDRNRLNEIASLVRSLTYGEMIELSEAIWKVKPEGEIAEAMLPGMLHQWATKPKEEAQ